MSGRLVNLLQPSNKEPKSLTFSTFHREISGSLDNLSHPLNRQFIFVTFDVFKRCILFTNLKQSHLSNI